jgi:sugar phosphate isomerase/epimerase
VDTFHMNIEERSMTQSIKEGGRNIAHVHLRQQSPRPGSGTY